MPGPCFTAGIVAKSQLSLKQDRTWCAHVPDESIDLLNCCLEQAAKSDPLIRLIRKVPSGTALNLLNRIIAFGYPLHIAIRKQTIEVQTRAEITRGTRQVVVLGGGFDTLSFRLANEFRDVQFFEIDLDEPQSIKKRAWEEAGYTLPSNFHFITADLHRTPLIYIMDNEKLFVPSAQSLFIAEGISMYLSENDNRAWLRGIRALCGQQAKVLFTFIETAGGQSLIGKFISNLVLKQRKSPYTFAMHEDELRPLVEECGYRPHWIKHYAELQRMYHNEKGYQRLTKQSGEHLLFAAAS